MKTLNPYWFSEGLLDLEYKRYILLAYLQEVEEEYLNSRIFPALQNLAMNLKCMTDFKDKCEQLSCKFPKTLNGFDSESGSLQYSADVQDPELLQTVYDIIDFSLPKVELKLEQGKEIYDSVEQMINIEPIGVLPIYKDEGYLFIQNEIDLETEIYNYKMSILEENGERMLRTSFMTKTKRTFSNTFYNIKESLIKEFSDLPNPATFLITSKLKFPKEATLLPVAKRIFMRKLITDLY